jgi:hypothetical protein
VESLSNGSYRNHCPVCLCSVHVDLRPGDRANACGGRMRAAGLAHSADKGWQIVHRCERCGGLQRNRIASDTEQADDIGGIAALSGRRA